MLPRLNCYYLWTDGSLHCVQYFVHCKHGVITLQVNGDIPTKVKKDAHAVILDFIRSRPPLHPVSLSLVYHWSALSITGQLSLSLVSYVPKLGQRSKAQLGYASMVYLGLINFRYGLVLVEEHLPFWHVISMSLTLILIKSDWNVQSTLYTRYIKSMAQLFLVVQSDNYL